MRAIYTDKGHVNHAQKGKIRKKKDVGHDVRVPSTKDDKSSHRKHQDNTIPWCVLHSGS